MFAKEQARAHGQKRKEQERRCEGRCAPAFPLPPDQHQPRRRQKPQRSVLFQNGWEVFRERRNAFVQRALGGILAGVGEGPEPELREDPRPPQQQAGSRERRSRSAQERAQLDGQAAAFAPAPGRHIQRAEDSEQGALLLHHKGQPEQQAAPP